MSSDNLQDFQAHPSLWDDVTEDSKHMANRQTTRRRQGLSWPLTSFANTVQNVSCISFILGGLFVFNFLMAIESTSPWRQLCVYFISLTLFHLFEFLVTAIWNPSRVTVDSFLLNNGLSYYYAQLCCVTEYVVTHTYFLPQQIYHHRVLSFAGLAFLILGQLVRSSAMITAAQSFNHKVSTHERKQDDHILVTTGIYRLSRHPSYLGFFWWSLGIQVYLGNWLSFTIFAIVLWKFFNYRIKSEEKHLLKFFGKAYMDYKSTTPTHIPFIK